MKKLAANLHHADVEVLGRETLHKGFLQLDRFEVRHALFDGGSSDVLQRELLVKDQAVGVLLYDPKNDEVVLVRQFRIGLIDEPQSPWLLELIAGMVGENESLSDVAIRESKEESNCVPMELIEICTYFNSPGTSNEKLTLFCGRVDASSAGGIFGLKEEHEDIEVVVLPFSEVFQATSTGKINNAMTIIAVQWLQLNKLELQGQWS